MIFIVLFRIKIQNRIPLVTQQENLPMAIAEEPENISKEEYKEENRKLKLSWRG
jgi:hypothetical protein